MSDLIDLSAIDADSTLAANDAFNLVDNATTSTAGERQFEGAGGAISLLQSDIGGNGASAFELLVTISNAR